MARGPDHPGRDSRPGRPRTAAAVRAAIPRGPRQIWRRPRGADGLGEMPPMPPGKEVGDG